MTIREEKGIKGIQTGKDEKKLLLFTDDSVLCIENTKVTIRKSLELISEFSKFAGYINNTQKSLAILYTKNKKNIMHCGRMIQEITSIIEKFGFLF